MTESTAIFYQIFHQFVNLARARPVARFIHFLQFLHHGLHLRHQLSKCQFFYLATFFLKLLSGSEVSRSSENLFGLSRPSPAKVFTKCTQTNSYHFKVLLKISTSLWCSLVGNGKSNHEKHQPFTECSPVVQSL